MNTNMKKLTAITSAALLYSLMVPQAFAAIGVPCAGGTFSTLCNSSGRGFGDIVQFVINILFVIAVILAIIFLIWNGIRWILSGGDKARVEAARSGIIGALIGLVIALAAFILVN